MHACEADTCMRCYRAPVVFVWSMYDRHRSRTHTSLSRSGSRVADRSKSAVCACMQSSILRMMGTSHPDGIEQTTSQSQVFIRCMPFLSTGSTVRRLRVRTYVPSRLSVCLSPSVLHSSTCGGRPHLPGSGRYPWPCMQIWDDDGYYNYNNAWLLSTGKEAIDSGARRAGAGR